MEISLFINLLLFLAAVYTLSRNIEQKKKINYNIYGFVIGVTGGLLFSILAEYHLMKKIDSTGARKNFHFGIITGIFISLSLFGLSLIFYRA